MFDDKVVNGCCDFLCKILIVILVVILVGYGVGYVMQMFVVEQDKFCECYQFCFFINIEWVFVNVVVV